MSSIVENQRAAFVHQAMNDLRATAHSLRNLSPAEQAASIATLAHALSCPIDVLLLTEDPTDGTDAARIADGVLTRSQLGKYAWNIGSGCHFVVTVIAHEEHR